MKNKFKVLNDREHILQRSGLYIGSTALNLKEEHIWNNDSLQYQKIEYVPALLKITNEIIDNAVDDAIRSGMNNDNTISVTVEHDSVEVKDNGSGIPVEFDDMHKEYYPVMAWGRSKAGSNFDDDETRNTIGLNGVGSFATNCFSTKFTGKTCDGKSSITCKWTNNAEDIKTNVQSKLKNPETGTMVKFSPDFSRFDVDEFDEVHQNLIFQRIVELSISYPEIKFRFNSKVIRLNFKKLIGSYISNNYIYEDQDISLAFCPQPGSFNFYGCVNGIRLYDAGGHIEYIKDQLSDNLRQKLLKKYPNLRKSDIVNNIFIGCFLRNFDNPAFDSQTKTRLTNSRKEVAEFFKNVDFNSIADKIAKKKEIIEPILEFHEWRAHKKEKDYIKQQQKKKIKCEGYLPPIGDNKYLFLCEGYSASSSLSNSIGRQGIGYFSMRGVPLNVLDKTDAKVIKNKEIFHILKILDISLTDENKDMNFENVTLATDYDLDGIHIRGLLIGFFYKYCPEILKSGRVSILNTPIVTFKDKSGNIVESFYSLNDYNKTVKSEPKKFKKYEQKYYKGLGSWKDSELKQLVRENGLDKMIELVEYKPEKDVEYIKNWLESANADIRKEYIKQNSFNINMA